MDLVQELAALVGPGNVIARDFELEPYSHDETSGFACRPRAAVRPATTAEVSALVGWARQHRVPLTARGGGTGKSAGAVPDAVGVVISFERMNRILEIDPVNQVAVVQPGVTTGHLQEAAAGHGLFFAPDPASVDTCTIGGNIAECAGGMRAFKYGTTKQHVLGLEVVWPDCTISRLGGRLVKNVTGYDLIGLLCGSEGTLALFTEAVLRLTPIPAARIDLLIPFDDLGAALDAARAVITARLVPATLEFMEQSAVRAAEQSLGRHLPFADARAQLIVELDGPDPAALNGLADAVEAAVAPYRPCDIMVALDEGARQRVWEARRAISDALKSRGTALHEDIVVPRARVRDLVHAVHALAARHNLEVVCYGHVGDGNVHVNVLRPPVPESAWQEQAPRVAGEIFRLAIERGGMISGEHGIGLAKKAYLSWGLDVHQVAAMKAVKRALDPENVLNPGKGFDLT